MPPPERVVLLTGGRRIGAAVALELARRGADVALSYFASREPILELAGQVRALGRRAFVKRADLRAPAECRALVDGAVRALGRLDIVINMASVYVRTPFDELSDEAFEDNLRVDLASAYYCARAAVPHLRSAGGGHIINFSDWVAASRRPRYPGYLAYYVAKAGVIGLTEALALELAADGILVNAVAPGPILPPEELEPEEQAAVERATPLGRWGGEDAIVKTVMALLDSDFITGETIRVDGGRHVR